MKLAMVGAALAVGAVALGAAVAGTARPAVSAPLGSPRAAQVAGPAYDGRYAFARVRYGGRGRGFGGFGGAGASWSHDYPAADLNMQTVLAEATLVKPVTDGSVVVDLEDPAVFGHPILYMAEPGFWGISDQGAKNLRSHLLKGGFIIFDDFDGYGHWENWLAQMKRALPEYDPIPIDESHPVFQSFFFVEDIYVPNPMVRGLPKPTYFGIFENNDPSDRMLALVNYNSDLAEYWEYVGQGFLAIDPTNDAFRLGVNYIIYGLTH